MNENIIFLLKEVTKVKANAQKAVELGVPEQCVNLLETQRSLTQNDAQRPMYLNIVTIVRYTGRVSPMVAELYHEKKIHEKLIVQMRQSMAGNDLQRLKLLELKTASVVIDALVALMEQSETILVECLDGHDGASGFHVQTLFILAPQMPLADPMILASSIDGLRVILENKNTRDRYIKDVVEAMQKLSPLLQYLSSKKYYQLYSLAMLHTPSRAETAIQAPPLGMLHNRIMHTAFVPTRAKIK